MKTVTRFRRSEQRNTLAGMIAGVAAMIFALALALSLTPSPASAETPAERCKRETSAYNAAWAAIGKKPPAPYTCGGSNEPPPTLSPTTPEETPDETVAPTTSAPAGDDDSGPGMNAPTERRELEHPGQGQAPIGKPYSSATPSPRRPTETGGQVPTRDASTSSNQRPQSAQRGPLPGVEPRLVEGGTPNVVAVPDDYVLDPERKFMQPNDDKDLYAGRHDYCSTPGLNVNQYRKADWRGPCARHDMCYDRNPNRPPNVKSEGKKECDEQFKRDLYFTCDGYSGFWWSADGVACRRQADVYYQSVKSQGGSSGDPMPPYRGADTTRR